MELTCPPRRTALLRAVFIFLCIACAGAAVFGEFLGIALLSPALYIAAAALGWCAFLVPTAVCGSFRVTLERGRLAVERGVLLRRRTVVPARQVICAETVSLPLGRMLGFETALLRTPSGTLRLRFLAPQDAEALRDALTASPTAAHTAAAHTAATHTAAASPAASPRERERAAARRVSGRVSERADPSEAASRAPYIGCRRAGNAKRERSGKERYGRRAENVGAGEACAL